MAELRKTTLLRNLITNKSTDFLMEAHNGISAKIVEEAGFKGIWASSLTMSSALGLRDCNEASWTQVLDIVEYMNDATRLPILLDADTGYGNFNNARRLIRKLEQRGIAGVCIEDNVFPKTSSFLDKKQPLADIGEFCGKIRACKDVQTDPNFVFVARTEAFIAGYPVEEALRRAMAYKEAGCDAILIHSKKTDSSEIDEFMKYWKNQLPLIIAPTKYYKVPTAHFIKLGVSLVIWSDYNMRASVTAMRRTSKAIFESQSTAPMQSSVVPTSELFELCDEAELREAEKKYLPNL